MSTIRAIYENGVFRPTAGVDLPEHSEVEFEPRIVPPPVPQADTMAEIYDILSRSYPTGDPRLASRHNEHQP